MRCNRVFSVRGARDPTRRAMSRHRRDGMVTIMTEVHLKEGAGHDWDTVMHQRMAAAKKQPGWIGGQVLRSDEDPLGRTIVGTWKTQADWQEWHRDARFEETRGQLDALVD